MKVYEVGKIYEELISNNDGMRFDLTDGGAILRINYTRASQQEIEDIKNSEIQYKLLYFKNVIWMFFKFGNQNWVDAPYAVQLSKNLTNLQEVPDELGYGCTIYFVENSTGELLAMRYISFSTKFSRALKEAVEEQRTKDFDVSSYSINLSTTMNQYSTRQLLSMSRVSGRSSKNDE